MDTMIRVSAPLTCGYKKYLYLLPADIHFQYPFPTRCGFYPDTNFFDIPSHTYYIIHKLSHTLSIQISSFIPSYICF